ncbi:MAG: helix-turn-helix domain-containing protein [Actinomycetota bacterium]|jgi:predicted DNA-binding transcriptional regulator AlpA|nr:helix-turn-helix domain-containing protein [Actinomycetota bacterium]MCL6093540.1 helix-turn-helix domain-containing protein [Actinomycetota bacterium]MDA8166327.1 helix-turn-helix domain-containing protein [Actinomycetota bacterium]
MNEAQKAAWEKYLNEKQVSDMTGISVHTLRNQRAEARGIPYSKIGRSVRYAISDVMNYMESGRVVPGGES